MDFADWSARELSAAISARDVSARELMTATLDRVAAVNGPVNALVSLRDHDVLMAAASEADGMPSRGWLHGIPIAIKDLVDVKGLPTSKGSPIYAGNIARANHLMVARLQAAGAIVVGKTNVPEFGFGSHTVNPVFGATRNPYDLTRSAGGSSGGAAAALATGMLPIADGSDMMGSLRNPAAWNNVYGMRPTWGLVPPEPAGEIYFRHLSTLGPMARCPRDLAALLDTMSGTVRHWPFGREQAPALSHWDAPTGNPRVAWLRDWDGAYPLASGVAEICDQATSEMSHMGWNITSAAAPFPAPDLWQAWCVLRSFNIAGEHGADYDLPERRMRLGPAVKWEIEQGRGLTAEQIYRASQIRSDWYRAALALFEEVDALLLPSAQVWPFPVEQAHPVEISGTHMDSYHRWMAIVVPASLIGLPVVNLPVGFGRGGLPMGLQLIGAPGSDAYLLRLAQSWHEVTEWPQRRPAFAEAGARDENGACDNDNAARRP
ncbi:MAG: amidase [Pseudomonadota bacterium]